MSDFQTWISLCSHANWFIDNHPNWFSMLSTLSWSDVLIWEQDHLTLCYLKKNPGFYWTDHDFLFFPPIFSLKLCPYSQSTPILRSILDLDLSYSTRSKNQDLFERGVDDIHGSVGFVNPTARIWNQAPEEIKTAETINEAKRHIRNYVKTLPIWWSYNEGDPEWSQQSFNLEIKTSKIINKI